MSTCSISPLVKLVKVAHSSFELLPKWYSVPSLCIKKRLFSGMTSGPALRHCARAGSTFTASSSIPAHLVLWLSPFRHSAGIPDDFIKDL